MIQRKSFTNDKFLLEEYLSPGIRILKISQIQLDILLYELEHHPDIVLGIYETYKINKLAELPEMFYSQTIDKVREIKKVKEHYGIK